MPKGKTPDPVATRPVTDQAHAADRWTMVLQLQFRRRILALVLLSAIVLLGGYLRFYELGIKGYHLDEALMSSALNPGLPAVRAILTVMRGMPNDVPGEFIFHYLANKRCNNEFGHRFAAALFGTMSVILIYGWAASVWGRFGGLAAAAILAISAWHIGASREASRDTYMLYFFTFALAWAHRKAAFKGGRARWIGFSLIAAVGLMFHLFVVIPLAVCACCAAIDSLTRWKAVSFKAALRYLITFAIAAIVPLIPAGLFFFLGGTMHDTQRYNPIPITSQVIWHILGAATGSASSETGTMTPRAIVVLGLAALGVVSLFLEPHRRRELGCLASLFVLAVYLYQASKGTKYFATRHTAFLHTYVLVAAAGGVAQLGDWLSKLWARLPVRILSPLAVKTIIVAATVGALAAGNRREIQRYYVYGLAYHWVPNRTLTLSVRDNILPNEDLYCEPWYYWFFKAYAPELSARIAVPSEKDLAKGRPYWYVGAHSSYKRDGFTQVSFSPNGWAMGYCCPTAKYDAAAFANRLQPSGAAQLDSQILGMVSDKGKFVERMLIKANSLRDRKEQADLLALCAGYFRRQQDLPPWRTTLAAMLSERSAALDPFNRYTLGYAALDALNQEKYEQAVRFAKQSIEDGETLNPVSVLQTVAKRTNGTVFSYKALLEQIDKAIVNAKKDPPDAPYTKRQLEALENARAEALKELEKSKRPGFRTKHFR
jgi:hypothetical protein